MYHNLPNVPKYIRMKQNIPIKCKNILNSPKKK